MGSTSRSGLRFGGLMMAAFVMAASSVMLGCAGQPYIVPSHVEAVSSDVEPVTEVIEGDAPAVCIVVSPDDPSAPQPEIIIKQAQAPAPAPATGWVPQALPEPNPFEKHRTWMGDYDCVQGNTGMALRIMDVRGRVVRAIFEFLHDPTGAQGSYIVMGSYDPDTRRVHFDPSSWIAKPDHYAMVPMTGEISADGSLFAGKIDHPGCGAFTLKPTR